MTLRTRLAAGFAIFALLLGTPLALTLVALDDAASETRELRQQELGAALHLGAVRVTTDSLKAAERAVLLVPDSGASREWLRREVRKLRAHADTLRGYDLEALAARLNAAAEVIGTYGPLEWAATADGNTAFADSLSERRVRPAIADVERAVAEAEHALNARAQDRVRSTSNDATEAIRVAGLVLAAALTGALGVGVWLTRSISRPVDDLERGMRAVADGDFDYRLSVAPSHRDEFGRLAVSFRSMADQLAELDKLKAEFVSVASHELKTPINVIIGYLTLLEDRLYGPVTDKQLEVLRTVEGQAQQLARLVQHLLDVSRFQAGAGRLEPRPLALSGFLADLEQTFGGLAHRGGVSWAVHRAADLPDVVTWDRDRMDEVLANLLSNAFKFTEAGGRVELTAAAAGGGDLVLVEVRDTGAGIPADQLGHIFDKFFQADNQGGSSQRGTGLGLAIAREIVEAHGGSIRVESTVGVGTRFTLLVPVTAGSGVDTSEHATIADDARRVPAGVGGGDTDGGAHEA